MSTGTCTCSSVHLLKKKVSGQVLSLTALFLGRELPVSTGQEVGNQSSQDGNEKLQTLLRIKLKLSSL
jgi:hypothetical protein